MKSLPILDGIRVASPCSASWDSMAGDDLSRFCSDCGKNVYNLSAMKTPEAAALIAGREGKVCVRFYRRSDGTTLTADCPVGARTGRSGRLRRLAALGLAGLAMASTVLAATGLAGSPDHPAPSGPGATLGDWVDWAMIQAGWRKPRPAGAGSTLMGSPSFVMGEATSVCTEDLTPPAPEDSTPGDDPASVEMGDPESK